MLYISAIMEKTCTSARIRKRKSISRGVPIAKALEDETLVAWQLNGKDIPEFHGYPLRLVIGGWPASVSGKWLSSISVRNKVHDGAKMEGHSYKMPKNPVAPGDRSSVNRRIFQDY